MEHRILQYLYSFFEKLLRLSASSPADNRYSRVYMFHNICPQSSDSFETFTSDPEDFRQFLTHEIVRFKPVPAAEILNNRNVPCFALTFDDGYDNFYSHAYPILKELHLPFTLFITVDYLDRPGYLTKKQLRELSGDPLCTVGAHTLSHPLLRFSTESLKEISLSKRLLEELTGKPITLFSYPFGSVYACSLHNIRLVRTSGYQLAFSAVNGSINAITAKNRYFIPRINADPLTKQFSNGELN